MLDSNRVALTEALVKEFCGLNQVVEMARAAELDVFSKCLDEVVGRRMECVTSEQSRQDVVLGLDQPDLEYI